jgi:ABC-type lipoprotein export system ATPase subunit/ABC-type antimicrobial peptide transport system permease subunit
MIKVQHVQKYFNRHRSNEIHVINDTSIELGNTGLVAILGNSGSGKTTLLNAIGGLDKVNKGKIYINDQKITRHRTGKIDEIRDLNIGYIFQNYYLIDNLTVYDNVAIALKMIGVKDKEEIRQRVEFILDTLGILRFKNRPAEMLSGGERQRVGIARALVKNPKIIIADEPTGNLDSRNSLEIMHILKAISKTRLVILVTHEQDLAKFFAERILELVDGKIVKDYPNEHNEDLDYRIENKIYLKDLPNQDFLFGENMSVFYFGDNPEPIKVILAYKNGNLFIKTNTKVEVVDDQSGMELVNSHYEKLSQSAIDNYEFAYSAIPEAKHPRYKALYNPFNSLWKGFQRVFNYSALKKFLLVGFVLSSMFIVYATSNIAGVLKIEDSKFITKNKNYVSVATATGSVAKYLELEATAKDNGIEYLIPGDSKVCFGMNFSNYYQTASMSTQLCGSLTASDTLSEDDLILGKLPMNNNEIVIDTSILTDQSAKQAGYLNYGDYLNQTVTITNMPNFKIVGIVNLVSPSIYVPRDAMINIIANTSQSYNGGLYQNGIAMDSTTDYVKVLDYNLVADKITLQDKSRWPSNDYECIINVAEKDSYKIGKQVDLTVNGTKLTVVGYYYSPRNLTTYLVSPNTVKYQVIEHSQSATAYTYDRPGTVSYLNTLGMNATDIYQSDRTAYIANNQESVKSSLVLAGIILLVSLVEIFLMMRSSFLSRVKEVGTLRAIGMKKGDIYRMFYGEVFAISFITSIIGIGFMSYMISQMLKTSYFQQSYVLNWQVIGISFLVVFVFNSLVGLLPVYTTLRKTPAAILSRIDVD